MYIWQDVKVWSSIDGVLIDKVLTYLKYVESVISNVRELTLVEKHHVLPKCFMHNSDVVPMLPSEHFICHRMLCDCFTGVNKSKICFAYHMMCISVRRPHTESDYIVDADTYQESRLLISLSTKGLPKSLEHRAKISKSHLGKTLSKSTRLLMSKNHADFTGNKNPNYGNHALIGDRNPNYGKVRSEEVRHRMSEAVKGSRWMVKGTHYKQVKLCDMHSRLLDGYELGGPNRNTTYVNDGVICRRVPSDDVNYFLSVGWKLGIINRTSNYSEFTRQTMSNRMSGSSNPMYGNTHTLEARIKISEAKLGRKCTLAEIDKIKLRIEMLVWTDDELKTYKDSNKSDKSAYLLSDEAKSNISKGHVGLRYINNGTICTAVSGDKVADYINSGWKYGRLKRKV